MKFIPVLAVSVAMMATSAAAEFKMSFNWGNIPSCTNGNPNRVPSPAFKLSGVPAGTTTIQFKLVDLNVPSYNHGGKKLKVTGSGTVPMGAFKYKSPCPPDGVHTYEWTATARAGSKVVGKAKARRNYP